MNSSGLWKIEELKLQRFVSELGLHGTLDLVEVGFVGEGFVCVDVSLSVWT